MARITVFTESGVTLHRVGDSSPDAGLARKALELVEESASLHRDAGDRRDPARRGRTAVLTFNVSSQGVDGVVLVQAPLRDIQEQVHAVERRLVFGGALAFGVALLAGALAAEPLARRLARLQAAADRIAHGSFEEPIVDNKRDEIGELARSLDEMRVRLDALDRARGEFIANASHELRTPLTALGGYLELLTEGGLTEAERSEFLETMGEQVQRLTKLATDLLDLSRLDAGGFMVAARRDRARRARGRRGAGDAGARGAPRVRRRGRCWEPRRSRGGTRAACSRCCACSWTTPCATRRPDPR